MHTATTTLLQKGSVPRGVGCGPNAQRAFAALAQGAHSHRRPSDTACSTSQWCSVRASAAAEDLLRDMESISDEPHQDLTTLSGIRRESLELLEWTAICRCEFTLWPATMPEARSICSGLRWPALAAQRSRRVVARTIALVIVAMHVNSLPCCHAFGCTRWPAELRASLGSSAGPLRSCAYLDEPYGNAYSMLKQS